MAEKAKLLIIIGTLSHMGGAERQALYLVEHLVKLSACAVEVLAFEDGEVVRAPLTALGVRVHVLPYYFRWKRSQRGRTLLKLAWLLRTQIRPDALLPFVGIHSKVAAQVWPYSGARFCWWNQQDEGRDLSGTPVEKRLLEKLSCITSNSFAGRDFLSATYGLDPGKILVYNNGTPLPELASVPTTWRSSLELQRQPIVTMVANVSAYKDHATLLSAWQLVRQRSDATHPVLLLAGYLKETERIAALKVKAFELGLSSEDVRFLGPVQDVADLMLSSDLVVHSSLTEGCPNAVCEAMALGRAVVATDIPGCRQALGPAGEVWLARPLDAEDLAGKIIRLLGDDELRRTAGAANRKRIESDFSIEGMNRFFQVQIEKGLNCSLSTPESK
jgi:glycosyltransferase involved in cell wall biosynthesis